MKIDVQADLHKKAVPEHIKVTPHPRRVPHHLDQRAQYQSREQDPITRTCGLDDVYEERDGEEGDESDVPCQGGDVAVCRIGGIDVGHGVCQVWSGG